ncbi:MAG: fused MFS/spermidine synthase [Candidatus Omnitrophica bacterium]|nr:fused MFS/spermidine synthase [Candidatus Omnitrophota bacterium]
MSLAYTTISFLASFMLFQIELIIAKLLLPLYGGSYFVWTTCMMFFTALLFLGYVYADFILRTVGQRLYVKIHVALLALTALAFPISVQEPDANLSPVLDIIFSLARNIGAPFLVLCVTSPLIQRWFSFSKQPSRSNPYFLYAASNAGALLALLTYPTVFEPLFTVSQQLLIWYAGYAVYVICHFFCLTEVLTSAPKSAAYGTGRSQAWATAGAGPKMIFYWTLVSASTCALMLAVTNAITLDIASLPLLWMLPLGIYLLTIILNFQRKPWYPAYLNIICLVLGCAAAVFLIRTPTELFSNRAIVFHSAILFIACMIGHRNLYQSKPPAAQLTTYYVCIGFGGSLAAFFIGVGIPFFGRHLALSLADYLLAIALVVASLLVRDASQIQAFYRKRKVLVIALPVLAVGLVAAGVTVVVKRGQQKILYSIRNFYGISRVIDKNDTRIFFHGSTIHGAQFLDAERKARPLLYFHPKSPVADVFEAAGPRKQIGVLGLGAGSLSAYSREGEEWDFYEIDPAVLDIAERFFGYLDMSRVRPRIVLGDGRLSLARAGGRAYDLLFMDAFSSDSVPVHLITREAVRVYLSRLAQNGLLVFNISNRYLNLRIILRDIAVAEDLPAAFKGHYGPVDEKEGESASEWFVISRSTNKIAEFVAKYGWSDARTGMLEPVRRPWTDQYVNILTALLAK